MRASGKDAESTCGAAGRQTTMSGDRARENHREWCLSLVSGELCLSRCVRAARPWSSGGLGSLLLFLDCAYCHGHVAATRAPNTAIIAIKY